VELESQIDGFRGEGLNVAALSYDPPALLADFAAKRGVTYPLLSDKDSRYIRALGLLNEIDYPVGHFAHGVPYPGVFVTDAAGRVRRRFFEEVYEERRTGASILATVADRSRLHTGPLTIDTPQLRLRLSSSNATAAPGQRLSLLLDFELPPGMHAYAPGARGYRAIALSLDPNPLITSHDWVLPPSESYTFAPLKETIPVFTGAFRAIQEVTLHGPKAMQDLMKAEAPSIDITGTLAYQVCSETLCFAPGRTTVSWRIGLARLDTERTIEALRKK
jgi:hypothetical protein